MSILKKPFVPAVVTATALALLTVFLLLEVYVIPHAIYTVPSDTSEDGGATGGATFVEIIASGNPESGDDASGSSSADNTPVGDGIFIDDTHYTDKNISITLNISRVNNTTVYIADIRLSSLEYLYTALARNTFGTNVTETTSSMAASHNAILAINGDFCGANRSGYVIKNGMLLRSTRRSDANYDDLVIMNDGSFCLFNENTSSAQLILSSGGLQLFGFGPTLVSDGKVVVSTREEVGQAMQSNPRTAIGIIEPGHYIFCVSDGRTNTSRGLSLYDLGKVLADCGCKIAYNLDGGGSTTMYFNGKVVNVPVGSGRSVSERAVSDIVCIGY